MYDIKSELYCKFVNYGLRVIIMCQCRLILCNKCTILVSDVDNRRGYACVRAGSAWDISVPSSQFCYKSKAAPKNSHNQLYSGLAILKSWWKSNYSWPHTLVYLLAFPSARRVGAPGSQCVRTLSKVTKGEKGNRHRRECLHSFRSGSITLVKKSPFQNLFSEGGTYLQVLLKILCWTNNGTFIIKMCHLKIRLLILNPSSINNMICVLSTCNVYYEGLEREENVREVPYILCKYQ